RRGRQRRREFDRPDGADHHDRARRRHRRTGHLDVPADLPARLAGELTVEKNNELIGKIKWLLLLRVAVLTFFVGAAALSHFFKGGDPTSFKYLQLPLIAAYLI